jgi:membrane protease YdiL (CAAX protease family)
MLIVWCLGASTVIATRFRGEWDAYRGLHRTARDLGVPEAVRNLDGLLLALAAAFAGATVVARWWGGGVNARLGLQRGRAGWWWMAPVALLPMVGGGLVLGSVRLDPATSPDGLWLKLLSGVVRAPIAEEMLFRGLLVGVAAIAVGRRGPRFWINAAAAALLFAATHVQWNAQALAAGWSTLLVTGLGGLWYAWLLVRWESLWPPMLLHAGMNLGWMLAAAGGGAGGGGWVENLLRVATIVIATWWTARLNPVRTIAA